MMKEKVAFSLKHKRKSFRSWMQTRFSQLDVRIKLSCFILYLIGLFHAETVLTLTVYTVCAFGVAWATRVERTELQKAFKPFMTILVVTVAAQLFYYQGEQSLFQIGALSVSTQALTVSALMLIRLMNMMVISISFMHCTSTDELLFALSWFLTPLRKMGLRTDAFLLSLNVALTYAPLLVNEFQQLKKERDVSQTNTSHKSVRSKMRAYNDLLCELFGQSLSHVDNIAASFANHDFQEHVPKTDLQATQKRSVNLPTLKHHISARCSQRLHKIPSHQRNFFQNKGSSKAQ